MSLDSDYPVKGIVLAISSGITNAQNGILTKVTAVEDVLTAEGDPTEALADLRAEIATMADIVATAVA